MKRLLLSAATVAVLTASVPASAQVEDAVRSGIESIFGGRSGASVEPQLRDLNYRLQTAYQRGAISRSEVSRLQSELRGISEREQEYRRDGISRAERDDLQQRLRWVDSRITQATGGDRDGRYDDGRDQDTRYGGDGRDTRYDRDEPYGRDDRDDWNDRYSQGGRWNENYGRYDRDCPPGLAKKNNGCLPPGQASRAGDQYSDEYSPVPRIYGERYRDTSRYLYRYNDGRIYQIDRRSGRIVQVTSVRR